MREYFSHDYNSRNDPKMIKLLQKMGYEGHGIYWALIEMIYEENGYLKLSECESYAFALHTQCDKLNMVISEFDLFENDGTRFWSESALIRLQKRDEKSEKASNSAKIRWLDANEMQSQCDGYAIKENKRKEINTIVEYLNSKCNTSFQANNKKTIAHINQRLKEKFTVENFKLVIDFKKSQWFDDPERKQYLRPETLFGTKFESYLQAAKNANAQPRRILQ